jgi:glycosyltransferase involved in cell wall biosynthesis
MPGKRLRVLYVEPFEAGSHAGFGATLREHLAHDFVTWTLPGRHWKWRMRGAGLWFAEQEPAPGPIDVLLASSYTPLADLCALRRELTSVPRVLYFHENQWEYPNQSSSERDHHLAFTQVVSAAAADLCLFNSQYNRDTFLRETRAFVARMPDARPTATVEALAPRCEVLPVPVAMPRTGERPRSDTGALTVLWNHRWEHDKRPEAFFAALQELADEGVPFRVAVCGQAFGRVPPIFEEARTRLGERIVQFGSVEDRRDYEELLGRCDVVVSTAAHEFFGVSVLEATRAGCRPLVPDRLAYPELIPRAFRYRDDAELVQKLRAWITEHQTGARIRLAPEPPFTAPFRPKRVAAMLETRLCALIQERSTPPR